MTASLFVGSGEGRNDGKPLAGASPFPSNSLAGEFSRVT